LALLVTGQRQGATAVRLGVARLVDGSLETALPPWGNRGFASNGEAVKR
jgi:hypothetical protein